MEVKRDIFIAQLINFWLLFSLVKHFFGDKIIKTIEERKQLIKKLKQADEEYERMIDLAKKESNKLITKANKKRETILLEWRMIADEERKKILDLAMGKADVILQDAETKGEKMMKDLETERTNSVTSTTQVVVNKLLNSHDELKEQYLQTIAKDLKEEKKKK